MIITVIKDILPIIEKAAPLLAAALSGQGWLTVLSLISTYFGVDPNNIEALKEKLNTDVDRDTKLLDIQTKHSEALTQLSIQALQINTEDRKDARKYSFVNSKTRVWLIVSCFLGIVICLSVAHFLPESPEKHYLYSIVGFLIAHILPSVYRSEFGN